MSYFTKSQLTNYAHDYLSGYNNVPIGALDDPFFKAECKRLWGPEEPVEKQISRLERHVKMLEKILKPLYGPRGGLAKKYRDLEFNYHICLGDLEELKAMAE